MREFKARDGGPDLRPSVYDPASVEEEIVRAYAEHAHAIDPPREALGIDVVGVGIGQVVPTDGKNPFEFARERHREILLEDRAALLGFIRGVASAPKHKVARTTVVAYVKAKLEAKDPEWETIAAEGAPKRWLRDLVAKDE